MFRIKQEMIEAIAEIEKEAKNLEEKKQEILKDYGVVSENGLTIEEKEKFQKQLNENAQYDEAGRGRHKVVYTHPDKKNVGNDRFEHRHEAEKYKKSLEKKGYHNVRITEEDLNESKENLQELSKATLKSYTDKSIKDVKKRSDDFWKSSNKADSQDDYEKHAKKLRKRNAGTLKAIKKVNEAKVDPVHAKQLLGSLKKQGDYHALDSDDKQKIIDAAKTHKYRASKNAPGSTGRMFHQHLTRLANKVSVKEEELNEISKKTLSSYLERAPLQSVNHAMSADTYREGAKKSGAAARRKGLSDASVERHKAEETRKSTEMQKHLRKKTNRLLGTKMASNKLYGIGRPKVLATEETQSLDEISASLADRYLTKSAKERSERKHKKDREPSRKVAYNKMLAHDDKNDAPVKIKTGTRPKAMEMATADISKTFSPEGLAKIISREKTARDSDPKFQEFKKRNNKE